MQALWGEPLTIFGDRWQTGSFCYVNDLVDGLVKLMESPYEVTGPISLGKPRVMTMLELAWGIVDLMGGETRIEYRLSPTDDPTQRQPRIDRARDVLGWAPTVRLEKGLARTIDNLRREFAQVDKFAMLARA